MRLRGGWRGRARRLTVWILVSLRPGRGGRVYRAGGGVAGRASWASCGPRSPSQGALGRSASPRLHTLMRTLLSWSSVTLSSALRSDVFLEQTLMEEGSERKVGSGSLGKISSPTTFQASCCWQLGIQLPASVHLRMVPFLMNHTRMKSYSSPRLAACKFPIFPDLCPMSSYP